jgi:hypothetical protein
VGEFNVMLKRMIVMLAGMAVVFGALAWFVNFRNVMITR